MIVVYVEMWPEGDQERAVPLGSLALNRTTADGDLLDSYKFEIDEAPIPAMNVSPLQMQSVVQGHNRKQSVWKLIRRAIDVVFPPINIVT